jgi:hypothetical protein
MRFDKCFFGTIRSDGYTYEHDVMIDRGKIRKREKTIKDGSRAIRVHAALDRRGNPLAMPSARHQPYVGFDKPIDSSIVGPTGASNPRLHTIVTAGFRVVFDWRHYLK